MLARSTTLVPRIKYPGLPTSALNTISRQVNRVPIDQRNIPHSVLTHWDGNKLLIFCRRNLQKHFSIFNPILLMFLARGSNWQYSAFGRVMPWRHSRWKAIPEQRRTQFTDAYMCNIACNVHILISSLILWQKLIKTSCKNISIVVVVMVYFRATNRKCTLQNNTMRR